MVRTWMDFAGSFLRRVRFVAESRGLGAQGPRMIQQNPAAFDGGPETVRLQLSVWNQPI